MRSMTGFGRGAVARDGWDVAIQASSVNRKSLEVVLSLPREWQSLEAELGALVRERVNRGRVQISVEIRGANVAGFAWDDAAVEAVLDRLAELARRRGTVFEPDAATLLQLAHSLRTEAPRLDPERAVALLREALEPALTGLVETREREGSLLARDLRERAAILARLAGEIEARAPATVAGYRELLHARLRQAGLAPELEDERVLKEIALFAERVDIAEEITRLGGHLGHLDSLIDADEPVGRKAEFVLQEIGREIHTIGSKANDLEIARRVIEFKNELERIREQMQNVE